MSELRARSPACTGAWESRERAPTRGRSSHVEAAETAREATTSGRLPFPPMYLGFCKVRTSGMGL